MPPGWDIGGRVPLQGVTCPRNTPQTYGAPTKPGEAFLFLRSGATWNEIAKIKPGGGSGGDEIGNSVSISGDRALVGARQDNHAGGKNAGSAYVFRFGPGPPTTYCTAGASASGCLGEISASGCASATAPSGFDLVAANVEGGKDGLFFFGWNGRQANPWGNGTSLQCVVPPVKRGGLLAGVGTSGQCDGAFSQDLNARWTATPKQNPGAGAVVQAQLWYRDPLGSSNQLASLSDAIEFYVCP